jgi:glyoxylase-like metal-dependent hydrolase (beta-lactamase superfamily II)
MPEDFDIRNYRVYTGSPSRLLNDGDSINIGNRKLQVIHTPGHSPGHICLLEEERGYLFTGDLIYKGTLYAFYPSTNPLQFKQSVDKINCLKNLTKILPGHNDLEVKPDFLRKVRAGFEAIENQGQLKQGSGTFSFDEFKIQI